MIFDDVRHMEYKGINYDTGTKTLTGTLTRVIFDPDIVSKEIDIIKNELHCNSIRITGFYIKRVAIAAEIALIQGLAVWFSPFLQYDTRENTLNFIIESAAAAEKLRLNFPDLIFVAGCELSLFTIGFVKGGNADERLKNLFGPISLVKNIAGIRRSYNTRLNKFLSAAVYEIKKIFHGRVTYASGTWEKINWENFDIIGVDLYRSSYNKLTYLKELQGYKKYGKPLSIMEFGCCSYRGADDKGAMGWAIVDWKKDKPELKGNFIRDEETQAKYISELLDIFVSEKLFAAFVFTFVTYNYIHDDDPKYDTDMASYGIAKVLGSGKTGYKNLSWLPKLAFFELARFYTTH